MLEEISETNIKGKILIAEDDDSMRRFLEVSLKRQNYQVFTAIDGLEGIEIALNNEIDLIVTDAIMPNLTGYDLCRILRQTPEKKHIPIIILSGFNQDDESDSNKCLADFYLMKGDNLNKDLIDTISRIFNKLKN